MSTTDDFGLKDVTKEPWHNVKIEGGIIQGATLNTVLHAMFLIFSGHEHLYPKFVDKWFDMTEYIFAILFSMGTLESIVDRIIISIEKFLISGDTNLEYIAIGALQFLFHAIKEYGCFIRPLYELDVTSILTLFKSYAIKSYPTASNSPLCIQLIDIILYTLSQSARRHQYPTIAIENTLGDWDSAPEAKKKALKEQRAQKPVPTISVFGITPDLLDEDNEDDCRNSTNIPAPGSELKIQPQSRIPIGFQLLQDPSFLSIWDFDSLEIARQWTLLDHDLFLQIPLHSLSLCQWTEPRYHMKAVEVRKFIDHFNSQSCWITQSILKETSSQRRAGIISKYIDIAANMDALHNFNGVMAVVTGLQQGCITRLHETQKLISKQSADRLSKLQMLLSGNKNYQEYRDALVVRINMIIALEDENHFARDAENRTVGNIQSASFGGSGIVPHLGAHLAELCTIEEGNSQYCSDAPHLLNMEKKMLTSRCLMQIMQMHKMRYTLTSIRLIQAVLLKGFREGQRLSSTEAANWSREMYSISSEYEGKKDTATPSRRKNTILQGSDSIGS